MIDLILPLHGGFVVRGKIDEPTAEFTRLETLPVTLNLLVKGPMTLRNADGLEVKIDYPAPSVPVVLNVPVAALRELLP